MEVSDILRIYGEAWVEQDTDKILSIFCKEGTYQERAFEKPFKGHAQIASYWKKKVCEEESDISFKLLNYYTFGIVVVAEWEASFRIENERIHIKEVAIIEIEDGLIKSFREYWHKE